MGILVPLYLAGLTALSLPLILHLVRRTPRGRQAFGSLMFLSPTPPKLTRRSRLDQILLLLLRLAALALIVLAFSRPFLREAASLTFGDLSGKRLAILIDTSASMKRADLWAQAIKLAEKELDELNPHDDVALFSFGGRLNTIIDFQKEGAAAIADKPQVVRNRLKELRPDWSATDLGTALVAVASELDSVSDATQSSLDPLLVVISDFQAGSRIEALQSFEWPSRVPVVARAVELKQTTNAHAHLLPNEAGDESTEVRVRIVNASNSTGDNFRIGWQSERESRERLTDVGDSMIAAYVPAGQSRVIRLPRGSEHLTADRIVLSGDEHSFDNTFFVVPPRKLELTIPYFGSDSADDPQGLSYYLRLAVANDPLRQVDVPRLDDRKLLALPPDLAPKLVVVSQSLADEWQAALHTYVEQGGLLLFVIRDDDSAKSASSLLSDLELATNPSVAAVPAVSGEASDKYLLLGDIDFTHPLFAPFAGPRYGDFTKIHFWKHRRLTLKSESQTRVLARFDNGDPAILERVIGRGRVIVLTSGWQPDDSQLAVSSKFVPLIGALLDLACGSADVAANVVVNEPITLPTVAHTEPFVVRTPNDSAETPSREMRLTADQTTFRGTDRPGIYVVKTVKTVGTESQPTGSEEFRFAVNLAASESNTAPLDLEQLTQRGVRFGAAPSRAERLERIRQQRDSELESRQKVWRWLIVAALATLILETWLAGRAERQVLAEG